MNSEIIEKFRERATLEARPLQASLELTYRCNERCTHCYLEDFKDDPKKILSRDDWFRVLEQLRIGGSLYLILMGGEPLLSPHFFAIAERATDLGFHVSMISNGLKIKNFEYAKRIKDAGVKMITFSLYSLDSQIHDTMTQVRGSHERIMKAIDFCEKAGLSVAINSLVAEANARGLFDLFDWTMKRGFEVKIDPNITPKLDGDLTPTKYRASRDTLLWFYRERTRRWHKSRPVPNIETDNSYICNAAKGKCAVTPYGELLPCIEIREPFGSLVTADFKDIWFGASAAKWREPRVKEIKENHDPTEYSFCEHCPGQAKNEHGDAFKLTPYSKVIAQVKKQVHHEFSEIVES
ncbi:MAG: radical SAM protein [Pseudomonadota bacterium]